MLHIVLALYLGIKNAKNRPVAYHERSKTRTAKGSKLMMITGSLLLVCLLFHFYDFYFVKLNISKGVYMVKTEQLVVDDMNPEISPEAQKVRMDAVQNHNVSDDMKWVRNITPDEKAILQEAFPKAEIEPDFYHQARIKFQHWHVVLVYLIFFAVVGIHLRHGFESAMQTFGLNHYKYSKLVSVLGIIYCWVICIIFTITPVGVFFGL